MGISYIAFACSIEELESVFSSRDEALFEALVESTDSGVRHYLASDERKDALRELFIGSACTAFEPHTYAYALIGCMYLLGTEVGETGGSYTRDWAAAKVLERLGSPDPLLTNLELAWPVPGLPPVEDWPAIGTLGAREVQRRARELEALRPQLELMKADGQLGDDQISAEFLVDLADIYKAAAAHETDLIMVAH